MAAIVGTAGIVTTITIIATGAAGNCDSPAQISHRPAPIAGLFRFENCFETGAIVASYGGDRNRR